MSQKKRQKISNGVNETNNKEKYLAKDLKKILFISIGIIVVLIILTIINARTNFLLNIANLITE